MARAKKAKVKPCKITRARMNLLPYLMLASPPLPIMIMPAVKAISVKPMEISMHIKNIEFIFYNVDESCDFGRDYFLCVAFMK